MENLDQDQRSLHTYDGSAQNNKDAIKKLKQFSQSKAMIYSFIVAFFVFVAVRSLLKFNALEKIYGNVIPEAAMNKSFGNQTAFSMYSIIGKWGFVGACVAMALFVFLTMVRPHLKRIKEYNEIINK
ncbi:hypothetical protein [Soonwooa sp.]|uniref:hypothetical protein n=1 Tax=Soonwooa sp. TaxID=1938592 RepID=UPI0026185E7D|nr:hypothetical protein [Soonwooa sp.]